MNRSKRSFINAVLALVVSLTAANPAVAGIHVIDGTNLSQNVLSATEEVAQTLKQVEQYATQLTQYSTQLQQYANMIQNTADRKSTRLNSSHT